LRVISKKKGQNTELLRRNIEGKLEEEPKGGKLPHSDTVEKSPTKKRDDEKKGGGPGAMKRNPRRNLGLRKVKGGNFSKRDDLG